MTESGTSIAFLSSTTDVAAPHGVERGQLQVVPRDSIDNTGPAGGIVSNVSDIAKWLLCRLDSGRYAGGRLFSERQARGMWAGQTKIGRAHGWTPVTVKTRMPASALKKKKL